MGDGYDDVSDVYSDGVSGDGNDDGVRVFYSDDDVIGRWL